jgi:hypothetical protein
MMQQMMQQQAHQSYPIKRYVQIDDTGRVTGVCRWDGVSKLDLRPGLILVQSDVARIGWTYVDRVFRKPDRA